MSRESRLRAALTLAAGAGFIAATGPAQGLEVKISGQLNRALMYVNDGEKSELFNVDTDTSSTRFRFVGTQDIGPGLKAGVLWEMEFQSNPSDLVRFDLRSRTPTLDERHIDVFLQSTAGKVSLGQGDGAGNSAAEVDLSGTSVINYSGTRDIGGATRFRQVNVFGPDINAVINQQDFESRYDRVRYDSPLLGPVGLAASYGVKGENDVIELAGRLSTKGALGQLAAALAWSREKRGGVPRDEDTFGGSISWLHGSGFNLTFAYTNLEDDTPGRDDRRFGYVKVGYKAGKHAVAVDYAKGKDQAANGDDADMIGVGYVYTPIAWMELYLGAKVHSLDRTGFNFDDITIITGGTRIKF